MRASELMGELDRLIVQVGDLEVRVKIPREEISEYGPVRRVHCENNGRPLDERMEWFAIKMTDNS